MKTLKIKIIEYADRDLRPFIGIVSVLFKNNVGVELDIDVEKKEYTKPNWYNDREDVFYIEKGWLKKHIVDEEYDVCVAAFNDKQWREDHNNSIGGTAEASPIHNTGVIYMTATDGQKKTLKKGGKKYSEFTCRLVHELCHICFDDLMERPDLDRTHFWDYEQNNLFGALYSIDLDNYETKSETKKRLLKLKLNLLEKLYNLLVEKVSGKNSIQKWAEAIKEFEGWYPGSRSYRNNNPGNLRYSKYQSGTKDGFSYFETYKQGWKALLYQLRIATDGRSSVYSPDMTLYDFFEVYAPSSDNNHPKEYAEFVADKIGVSLDIQIKNLAT